MTFCEILVAALRDECGLDAAEAIETAGNIIEWGAKNGQSGSVHYWPCKFRGMSPGERTDAIRERFNGTNLKEVCREFGVSHATVYRAVRR